MLIDDCVDPEVAMRACPINHHHTLRSRMGIAQRLQSLWYHLRQRFTTGPPSKTTVQGRYSLLCKIEIPFRITLALEKQDTEQVSQQLPISSMTTDCSAVRCNGSSDQLVRNSSFRLDLIVVLPSFLLRRPLFNRLDTVV